ncbi:hypothetical protein N7540_002028 [Penicillium herquei]|nr:hypothetical protein N7540_002028 [Penicillium herquei]
MFEDETRSVTRKAKQRDKKFASSSEVIDTPRSLIPTPQMQALVDPPSVRAINLFICAYAGGSYLDWLPCLYLPHERPRSLEATFEAVALGHMANEQHREDLRILAQESYGSGLQHTMVALHGPQCTAPETVASVLLLALFAVISLDSYHDAQTIWSRHIHGILTILESCSPSTIFHDRAGQGLLHHIISVVQMDCLQRRVPLPPQLRSLYSASWINQGFQIDFWDVLDRLALLNAQFNKSEITLSYVVQLQEVEKDIRSLLELMPQIFPKEFSMHDITDNSNTDTQVVFCPPVHIFSNFRVAQAWNTLRMIRLFSINILESSIVAYLSHNVVVPQETEMNLLITLKETSEAAQQAIINICASVPEFLRPGSGVGEPTHSFQFSAWARSLIWPLSLARACPHGSEEMKSHIDQQIQALRSITGMNAMRHEPLSPNGDKNW